MAVNDCDLCEAVQLAPAKDWSHHLEQEAGTDRNMISTHIRFWNCPRCLQRWKSVTQKSDEATEWSISR